MKFSTSSKKYYVNGKKVSKEEYMKGGDNARIFKELQKMAAAREDNATATSHVRSERYTLDGQEVSKEEYIEFMKKMGFSTEGDMMKNLFGNLSDGDAADSDVTMNTSDDPFAQQNLYQNESGTNYDYYTSDNTSENPKHMKTETVIKIAILAVALIIIPLIYYFM